MCDRIPVCRRVKLSTDRLPKEPAQKGYEPMSNYDPKCTMRQASPPNGPRRLDGGIREFIDESYNYMAAGVGLNGVCGF